MSKQNMTKKKVYEKPKFFKHGSIRDFTQTFPVGAMGDGGTHPANMTDVVDPHGCIGSISQVEEHRHLILDQIAQNAFREAIFEAVKPGDVVLDLGTGSAIHAMFAVQAGAKKVYAIEGSPIIGFAEEIVSQNNMSDKIEFIYGMFDDVELPEKVDVIITHTGFWVTVQELPKAVRRWLKPGGKLVPENIFLSFVPAELKDVHKDTIEFWEQKHYGLDFSAFKAVSSGYPHVGHFSEDNFLASPIALDKFDFHKEPTVFKWDLEFKIEKTGFVSGLVGWYTYNLSPTQQISAKPPLKMDKEIWKQPYLPLEKPLAVEVGGTLKCRLCMYWSSMESGNIGWKWQLEYGGQKATQSTFQSVPLSKILLQKFNQ